MQEIPKPQDLNPDRPLRHRGTQFTEDDRPESELLTKALHESCAYAQQLWDDLNAVRQYLLDSLPPDPRSPGQHTIACASPTGPGDEQGWQDWVNAFAKVSSVLCGPHGDSGFGLSRAREEAQIRRTAPVLTIRPDHPVAAPYPDTVDDQETHSATSPSTNRYSGSLHQKSGPRWTPARMAGTAVIGVLALRGLRRPRTPDTTNHG